MDVASEHAPTNLTRIVETANGHRQLVGRFNNPGEFGGPRAVSVAILEREAEFSHEDLIESLYALLTDRIEVMYNRGDRLMRERLIL